MNQNGNDRRAALNVEEAQDNGSTLLPMLLGGLVLIVIGAGVVMTVV